MNPSAFLAAALDYQRIGPNGAKVGTNADSSSPSCGWRQLQQAPPE